MRAVRSRKGCEMSNRSKVLRTVLVLGIVACIAGAGVFSAFSSQTDNPGNIVTAGTVALEDNDGGRALYAMTAAKPGEAKTSCIKVTYKGSLPATVKMFTPSTIGELGPFVNLKIEAGTQASSSFPSCKGSRRHRRHPLRRHAGRVRDRKKHLRQRDHDFPGRWRPNGKRTTRSSTASPRRSRPPLRIPPRAKRPAPTSSAGKPRTSNEPERLTDTQQRGASPVAGSPQHPAPDRQRPRLGGHGRGRAPGPRGRRAAGARRPPAHRPDRLDGTDDLRRRRRHQRRDLARSAEVGDIVTFRDPEDQ